VQQIDKLQTAMPAKGQQINRNINGVGRIGRKANTTIDVTIR